MQLKFRAYDALYSKMMYSEKLSEFFHAVEQRPEEQRPPVMAWTGLKDKNRREIYFGDIYDGLDNFSNPVNGEIEFCTEHGGASPFCDYDSDCNDGIKPERIVVIGDIYQNSDLLK
ncbi:MAG TPA: YopX family protein [Stellaceae bacterium]|jgi:hypothetical protein|nr:YopX family protein [Stellaceae bacterium]